MGKALLATVACILMMGPLALAQGSEIFVGYSNLQSEGLPNRNQPGSIFDTDFFRNRTTLHGVNVSVTGYGSAGFGFTGDASFARHGTSDQTAAGENSRHTDTYYFMAGPTLKFNRSGGPRVQPFLRVMAGGVHTRYKASTSVPVSGGSSSSSFEVHSTDFAASAGGGLDIRLGERTKLRLVQVDYAPVFLRDHTVDVLGGNGVIEPTTIDGQRQDNFRFSFGLVF